MKIKLTATSFYDISFHPAKTEEVDDEEWAEMDEKERAAYADELAEQYRDEVVEVGWEVVND